MSIQLSASVTIHNNLRLEHGEMWYTLKCPPRVDIFPLVKEAARRINAANYADVAKQTIKEQEQIICNLNAEIAKLKESAK